jgi:nucleoside-diphosphate-sugar epimerase
VARIGADKDRAYRNVTVIVTGAAGFIGMHVCERLLARGERVIGVDNFNTYSPTTTRLSRMAAPPVWRARRDSTWRGSISPTPRPSKCSRTRPRPAG